MLEGLEIEGDLAFTGPPKLPNFLKTLINRLIGSMEDPAPLLKNVMYCRCTGIWLRKGHLTTDIIINVILVLPQILNLYFMLVNLYINIYSLSAVVENLSYTCVSTAGLYMTFTFLHGVDNFINLAADLKALNEKFNLDAHAIVAERKTRFVTNFLVSYTLFGCLTYCISPSLSRSSCTHSGAIVCGLPTAGTFPYDVHKSHYFIMTYLFHSYCAFASVFTVISPMNFVAGTVIHICTHLDILKKQLKEVCHKQPEKRIRELGDFVEHHGELLTFATNVSDCFSSIMIVQSSAVSLIISVLCFQIALMVSHSMFDLNLLRYILHLGGWITELLLVSLTGHIFIEESLEMADIVYEIPWYDQQVQFQKSIKLILMRSQKPMCLRVASIGVISLNTFSSVLGSAYSYFTLLYDLIA